jgi:hypothetical protein
MAYLWYEVVDTEQLEQGDFLNGCPVLDPVAAISQLPTRAPEVAVEALVSFVNAIVLTQSCDLVGRGKVNRVLFCPLVPYSAVLKGFTGDRLVDALENLEGNRIFKKHLIEPCDLEGHSHDHRVALFDDAFSLPLKYVKEVMLPLQRKRLRLLPPYREYLAQRFATFLMRVGYPVDLRKIPRI